MASQHFSFGYHLNTWDLADEPLDGALRFLQEKGIKWYEALAGDTLGTDFGRRFMTLGETGAPKCLRDIDLFRRFGLFGRSQAEYGLRLASLYINAYWLGEALWPLERDAIQVISRFLHSCGSPVLVCGGGPPHTGTTIVDYSALARRLEEIGLFTSELGIRTAYHPHLDCAVQNRQELDELMADLDTALVGLCIDPAHLVINGSDPVEILRTYAAAVSYVHFKDCKGDVTALQGHARYQSFCELGQGVVDLQGMADVLLDTGYDGLVIIELDASEKSAEQSCEESLAFVQEELGLQLNPGLV